MHDLVVRGGTVVDGTGAPSRTADVAVTDGRVTEVGRVDAAARRTIDADGALVTPGFVDVHTHFDGQVTWDPLLTPSGWHGVTTVVMGNCGVGFAPTAPDRHEWLIELMEGVEDIPGSAMTEGIRWDWTTFPEYLDAVEATPHVIDIGAQIAHGPLRAFVMGDMGELGAESAALHAEVGAYAREQGIDALFALGPDSAAAVSAFGKGARHFDDIASILEAARREAEAGTTLLVKGSRFMRMERIADTLAPAGQPASAGGHHAA